MLGRRPQFLPVHKGRQMTHLALLARTARFGFLLALFLSLQACVSPAALVEPAALPKTETGYVAGVFSASRVASFGFDLINTKTQETTIMPFFTRSYMPSVRPDQFTMISLPAGTYRIRRWVTFATLTNEILTSKNLPQYAGAFEFDVTPGRVTFLGKFEANQKRQAAGIYFSFRKRYIDQDELAELMKLAYPNFSMTLLDPMKSEWKSGD